MEYRIARREDLRGILSLYAALNPDDAELEYDTAAAIWDETQKSGVSAYFIALDGERPIATCNVSVIPNLTRGGRPFAIIENVITLGEYRRMGIGKRVLEDAVQYARGRGCYKVVLLSGKKRTDAHAFYASIGFDGESKKGFEMRF